MKALFENRVRRAYVCSHVKKRSARELVLGALLFMVVVAACGYATVQDELDGKVMADTWTQKRRVCIVNWSGSPTSEGGN